MPPKIVLPPKYYLAHFFEFLEFLELNYGPVLQGQPLQFIEDFRSLSEEAQCAYVRMVNRKGCLFSRAAYQKYSELENPEQALEELMGLRFCRRLKNDDVSALLDFLTKPVLQQWLARCGVESKKNLSREALIALAQQRKADLHLSALAGVTALDDIVVQSREFEMEYLLFLYFGKIQKSLNLYTLRDLGIRKANEMKSNFRPRFSGSDEALTEYELHKSFERLSQLETTDLLLEEFRKCQEFSGLRTSCLQLRDQIYLEVAARLESQNIEQALEVWSHARCHPAREKQVRHLFRLGRLTEARQIVELILCEPRCDEELLFAEDFLARKFEKDGDKPGRKRGYLTEVLRNSTEWTLSDFYYRRPEEGVIERLGRQGIKAEFTENYLWNALFGMLFWEELFESDKAAVFNQFERAPSDLVGPEFFLEHQSQIEQKLKMLSDYEIFQNHIVHTVGRVYGKLNDIFQWQPAALEQVLRFVEASLKCSPAKNPALVLQTMAKNFEYYHSGYPDLLVHRDGTPGFIEVKAEGDSLRSKQLSKVRLLREAGYDVEVLRVKWQSDPNQAYVIVDVETTGGSAQWHRVTEIGAVKVQGGVVVDEFQTLVNPGRPIPRNIIQLTGITNEMVSDAPTFPEVSDRFLEFTEGAIFVAHNVRFDYGFIQREFQRLEQPFVRPVMCTCAGMKKAHPGLPSYSLKNLSEHFQISLTQHHRALADARAAGQLFLLINRSRSGDI